MAAGARAHGGGARVGPGGTGDARPGAERAVAGHRGVPQAHQRYRQRHHHIFSPFYTISYHFTMFQIVSHVTNFFISRWLYNKPE